MGEHRNLIIAIVVLFVFMIGYQYFVLEPMARDREAAREAAAGEQAVQNPDDAPTADPDSFGLGDAAVPISRDEALAQSQRVPVRTDALSGSINLTGARFDDLDLLRYDTEPDNDIPVTLLTPEGAPGGHYAAAGWLGQVPNLPGLSSAWTLVEGDVLTPGTPVVLEYRAGYLVFRRTIEVDADYLFTVTDTVANTSGEPVALRPYALVRQEGVPADLQNFFILHEGAVGVVGEEMFDRKFGKMEDEGRGDLTEKTGAGGWMGLTSKYWLAAVAPQGDPQVRGQFRVLDRPGQPVFESNYVAEPVTIPAGGVVTNVSHVYAGAKSQPLLARYEEEVGIERLTMAIDWGMFWFFTRPFFSILHFFYGIMGNYGLAIMGLVLVLKLVLFPLNNKAFASMAKMRAVAPKMTEIRERHKDNPQEQQKAMMELYKKEKINPVAGCLPILPQIPIFFALYKTVFISLDARHAPFFGWIEDMSVADPTNMWNLFGLLPYDPSGWPILGGILAIGLWPLIMGVTMWAQQSLNPPPPDKIQRQIFAFLPIVFTIVMAPFPAALIIYWSWNNLLTVGQQYIIMRRQGVETELDKNVIRLKARLQGKPRPVIGDEGAGATLKEKVSTVEGQALTEGARDDAQATPDPEKGDAAAAQTAGDSVDGGAAADPGDKTVQGEAKADDTGAEEAETPAGKPASTGSSTGRTRSNPAAKKKRTPPKKKPRS
ncbi:MAG: membrane protein insertase YidC [Oceanicaulis sp.]